jgi:hypothetical protein
MQLMLESSSTASYQHNFAWPAVTYQSSSYRRADLDIIDVIEDKKLWMMHLCVYPSVTSAAPIFGFDVISGPNKVTGAFHDFSPIGPDHYMIAHFANNVKDFIPSKQRELPEWARNIFSGHMVAAGNVRAGDELTALLKLAIDNLEYYLSNVGVMDNNDKDYTKEHNWYAINQKKNPHTPRVMESLGVEASVVRKYIDECLFPEIV